MNDDHGARPRRENGRDRFGRQALAVAVDVRNDRDGSTHHRATRRSDVRPRGNDDLITITDSEGLEGKFQRNCTVCEGDRMATAEIRGVLPFEFTSNRSGPVIDPSRTKHGGTASICSSSKWGQGANGVDIRAFIRQLALAGTPTTRVPLVTGLTTAAPAPITQSLPIDSPGMTEAPTPTRDRGPTETEPHSVTPGAT